jgi:hypothetical protein
MLWFNDSRERELGAKVERAAQHYQNKYGLRPTVCYVHPSLLMGMREPVTGIKLRASNSVLPHHFWLGNEEPIQQRTAA